MITSSSNRLAAAFLAATVLVAVQAGPARAGGSGDSTKGLAALLPADAMVVFGADNRAMMRYWKTSPLAKMWDRAMAQAMGGKNNNALSQYMSCWTSKSQNLKISTVGAVTDAGGKMRMHMLFRGITAAQLQSCAKGTGIKVARHADGKYLEFRGVPDGLGGKQNIGYLVVDGNTFAMAIEMTLGAAAPANSLTRKQLERWIASARSASRSARARVRDLLTRVDRRKALWFAGTAKGTSLATTLVGGASSIDMRNRTMTIEFDLDLAKPDMAAEAVKQFKGANSSLSAIPAGPLRAAAKDILTRSRMSASGSRLTGRIVLRDAVLRKAIPALEAMMGSSF